MKQMKLIGLFMMLSVMVLVGCDSGTMVAKVGDRKITQEQFDAFLKVKRISVNDEQRKAAAMDQYLRREALAHAIENSNVLDKSLTEAEINEFRKEMLISRYFEKYLKDKVNAEAIQNYYSSNKEKFEEKKVHVAHILLRTKRNMSDTEKNAKQTTVQAAYSEIKKGKSFEEIAKKYSEDAVSAKKGGDLGWLKQGAISKEFTDKVFAMKADEISEPFETKFGFHIVKLIEGPVVVSRPLEAVKGDIRYQLRNEVKAAEEKRLSSAVKVEKK